MLFEQSIHLPVETTDDDHDTDEIARKFMKLISTPPMEIIHTDDARSVFDQVNEHSNIMMHKSAKYTWLLDVVNHDNFVSFYLRYLIVLCNTSECDYLTRPKNRVVSNFIKLQKIVWNVTDKSDELCFKLSLVEFPYYLFQLLKLPQLHPSVCLRETNVRLLAHSSIGVLHNLINHFPNVRSTYRIAHGVRILTLYVTSAPIEETLEISKHSLLQYLSLRTAALLVLSFIVDEAQNEALHTDDSHIVYLLTALDDALKCPSALYSTNFGYQAQELLVGLKNLAGPDRNKKALIQNDAIKYIHVALKIAMELKFPYTPPNTQAPRIPQLIDADILAEKALEVLWSLSFVPESHASFTPGSEFSRLFDKFVTDVAWSSTCRRVAQGILWNLPKPNHSELANHVTTISSLMGSERQEPRRRGHLMISYQHSTKRIMIKVRDRLMEMGYSVWMDVDYAAGSFVDAMALGIEKASAIILGLSQTFKNSPHCRQEIKYAYKLGIPFFPLQLEPNFHADGWLGLLLATIIYIPLTDESMLDEAMNELRNQLGDLGHKSRAASEQAVKFSRLLSETALTQSYPGFPVRSSSRDLDTEHEKSRRSLLQTLNSNGGTIPTSGENVNQECSRNLYLATRSTTPKNSSELQTLSLFPPDNTHCTVKSNLLLNWNSNDVTQWIERVGLTKYREKFSSVNGAMLAELVRLRLAAPESLCVSLFRDLEMTLIDQLRLFAALAQLSSNNYPVTQSVTP